VIGEIDALTYLQSLRIYQLVKNVILFVISELMPTMGGAVTQ